MPTYDPYGDGNAPVNGEQVGITLNKILASILNGSTQVSVPANSSVSGSSGQFAVNDSFFYYYGATGWRRIAGSSF